MSYYNVPDDWGAYYTECGYCKRTYHASEGGCDCLEGREQCEVCKRHPDPFSSNRAQGEGWHDENDLFKRAGKRFCENHYVCACCGEEGFDGKQLEANTLTWDDEADELFCSKCLDPEHATTGCY